MRFDFIKHHRKEFPLTFMCEHLGVNRSSFYTWCDRPESLRSRTDQAISADIRRLFKQNKQRYGSPRIHKALQDEGTHIGRKRVERLMQKQGLRALHRNRHQPSYRYQQKTPPAANILQRDFSPAAPDTVWAGDITQVDTPSGTLYLAVVMDLYSREVVGWSLQSKQDAKLVNDALQLAIGRRQPQRGMLVHTDQGTQYRSADYQNILKRHGFVCSMSRKGNCWDNAPVESFFRTLKVESLYPDKPQDLHTARKQVFEYIEKYYNRRRIHSALGYQTPADWNAKARKVDNFCVH